MENEDNTTEAPADVQGAQDAIAGAFDNQDALESAGGAEEAQGAPEAAGEAEAPAGADEAPQDPKEQWADAYDMVSQQGIDPLEALQVGVQTLVSQQQSGAPAAPEGAEAPAPAAIPPQA